MLGSMLDVPVQSGDYILGREIASQQAHPSAVTHLLHPSHWSYSTSCCYFEQAWELLRMKCVIEGCLSQSALVEGWLLVKSGRVGGFVFHCHSEESDDLPMLTVGHREPIAVHLAQRLEIQISQRKIRVTEG